MQQATLENVLALMVYGRRMRNGKGKTKRQLAANCGKGNRKVLRRCGGDNKRKHPPDRST